MEQLLTTKEVATILRVDRWSLREMRRAGQLPAIIIGRRVRFRPSDLQKFLRSRTEQARAGD